ncbi:MAG TPA: hypothetical protein VFG03_17040 [Telluria sp.]|nr:hypothetical protein [Telluria sp.]
MDGIDDYQCRLIEKEHTARPPAPWDVWDLRAYSTWRDEIWALIADFADASVRTEFLASPPGYVVCDDLSWLDNVVYAVHGNEVDSKTILSDRLRERYRALRAVHGTRTTSLCSFYQEGLNPLVPALVHDQAREIFLRGEFSELTEASLQAAIAAVGSSTRAGLVYFECNEDMLIGLAGHYMLYGGEYLTSIAANLGERQRYLRVLKASGRPVLFVCDVPLDFIDGRTLQEFAGYALECIFQELLDGPDYLPDRWRGAGFSIRETLAGSHLIGHYHPVVRRDPLGA